MTSASQDDEAECARLLVAFYEHLNHHRDAQALALWSPGGEWIGTSRLDIEALGRHLACRSRGASRILVTNLLIDLDGDSAAFHCYLTVLAGCGNTPVVPDGMRLHRCSGTLSRIERHWYITRHDAGAPHLQLARPGAAADPRTDILDLLE